MGATFGCAALALLGACGESAGMPEIPDAAPPGNSGFSPPTETTAANELVDGGWVEVGPARWDCIGTASDDRATSIPVTLSGTVTHYTFPPGGLWSATVALYEQEAFPAGEPIVSAVEDGTGAYSMDVPVGTKRVAVEVIVNDEGRAIRSWSLNLLLEHDNPEQTLDFTSSGTFCDPISGCESPPTNQIAGSLVDCDGRRVSHAIVTASLVPGEVQHAPHATTGYSGERPETSRDGLFLVDDLVSNDALYLQAWGFVDGADPTRDAMTPFAELPAASFANATVSAALVPRRTP